MLPEYALHPERRALYAHSLQAPDGYRFDAGLATTYSMDFDTALAVPVGLTLSAAEDRDALLSQPLALLEGAQRVARHLVVFTDAGRIHGSSKPQSRLCSLLEDCIVEVMAPGGGAFHPKLWLLRFKPIDGEGPLLMRLLILSRNLTSDRSWDIGLTLDGQVGGRFVADNRALGEFVAKLPSLALAPQSSERIAWVAELAEQLRRTQWDRPEHIESLSFAVNGVGGKQWRPEPASKLGIISPFVDETTLLELSTLPWNEYPWLISRSDQLACISASTLKKYEHVTVLQDGAVSDENDAAAPTALEGLHAKIYVAEVRRDTVITVGSGNATCAGLKGKNVEVFATLTGKRSKLGGVAENLGPEGFGRLVRAFVPGEVAPMDAATRAGEERLRDAHRAVCKGQLRLRCEALSDTGAASWRLSLVCAHPLLLPHGAAMEAWPITVSDSHAQAVTSALGGGSAVVLATMACADLTAFVAFRLTDPETQQSLVFSTKLPIEGLPADRDGAVLRSVIKNRQSFFGYLRLLLADPTELLTTGLSVSRGHATGNVSGGAGDDMPMLEDLVRALCRGERRAFDAIDTLMVRLDADDAKEDDPVPDGFRELWSAFKDARQMQETYHAA